MEINTQIIENFYGVYLLYCTNPKYKGRTYIGYTVDPNRRIKQHNKGKKYGGAWKTSNKGPWVMVMIIHGFPNDITALRFEWAWQHPHISRRLTHVPKKKQRENVFEYQLRVLSEMLNVGPWNRLPLTVHWLAQDYAKDLSVNKVPPMHMPICYGPVISKKLRKDTSQNSKLENQTGQETIDRVCKLCGEEISSKILKCLNSSCDLTSHVICLSKSFLKKGEYIPIEGECPRCKRTVLWGDIVRKYKGCYENMNFDINAEMGNDFYSSDSE